MQGRPLNGRWRQQLVGGGAAGCHHGPLRPQWLRVSVFLWAFLVLPFSDLDLLEAQMSLGSLIEMGPLLPSCTCTLQIGQVLEDSCTDGVDILFPGVVQ